MVARWRYVPLFALLFFLAACGLAPPPGPEPTLPLATSLPEPTTAVTAPAVATATATAVATATAAATIADLGPLPVDEEALAAWLAQAWALQVDPGDLHNALREAGWQKEAADWLSIDLTGDGRDEWLLRLCTVREANQCAESQVAFIDMSGDFWVIGAAGILYRVSDNNDLSWRSAPAVVATADLTGDTLPDVMTDSITCGAHTCFHLYHIISAHSGQVANLVRLPPQQQNAWSDGIEMSYAEPEIKDATGDGLVDLVVRGGWIGSAGAGIHRGRVETWSWDGQAVTLAESAWIDANYRFHRLYDATEALAAGEVETARQLYEQVIQDESLEDTEWAYSADEIRDATRQFAAFRLVWSGLRAGDRSAAGTWLDWMQQTYPMAPLTGAAATLLVEWDRDGNLALACTAVTRLLAQAEKPTGPLADMGYANPYLAAEDVCPIP
jgi:hypothetical protein